jgi:hypothetical protein
MAYSHITASGATGGNVAQGHVRKVIIQYNNTVAGVTTVSDETGTAGTPLVATITNPTLGQKYEYWDMKNGLTVTSTVAVDMTVSTSSGQGGNQ